MNESSRVGRLAGSLLFAAACLGEAGAVQAQQSGADQTLAEVLFREAQKLVEAGKYSAACPKFAESQRLDPGLGTLLNLALCHEKEGRTATAWTEFRQAAGEARTAGRRDRLKLAQDHIAVLEPQLSKVVIQLAPEVAKQNPEVRFDDVPIARAAWGLAMPADPGTHQIRVQAGSKGFKSTIEVAARAAPITVTVSNLEGDNTTKPPDAAATATDPSQPKPLGADPSRNAMLGQKSDGSTARTVVLIAEGVVAVGGLALGAVQLGKASSEQTQVDELRTRLAATDPNPCRPGGGAASTDCAALRGHVDDQATASNIAVAGLVAGGLGAVALAATWLLWKPSAAGSGEVAVSPMLSAGTSGVVLTWKHR